MSEPTHHHLDCQETVARLFQYLDRELDAEEQEAVLGHLNRCGPCAHLFHFEQNVLTYLGERLAHTRAPEDLRHRISQLCLKRPSAR